MSSWRRLALVTMAVVAGCGPRGGAGSASGRPAAPASTRPETTGATAAATPTTCAEVRPRLEQLYRSEAAARAGRSEADARREGSLVADNIAMVLADCQTDAARFVPCIAGAASVGELENRCVVPLDAEGTEGER